MRMKVDETGITELVGLVDHVTGMNKVAFGFFLEDETDAKKPLLSYPSDDEIETPVREMLAEVNEIESRRLGRPGVPKYWKLLARNRHYFESTWKKHILLLDGKGIDPMGKLAMGLGVSVTNGCRYFICYFSDALRTDGWDDSLILEVLGVVDHYNSFNTLATAMQIESDIRPKH